MLSDSVDLMDKIFDADDAELSSKLFGDLAIVSDWDTLTFDLQESSLVNQMSNSFEIGRSISNVWLHEFEHSKGGPVYSYEGGIVDLFQTQKLQDFPRLWIDSINTSDADDNGEFGLSLKVEVSSGARLTFKANQGSLFISIFFHISLSSLEDRAPYTSTFFFIDACF